MTRTRFGAALALAALSAVWGTQYLVIRLAQAELPVPRAVALRFAVVFVLGQVAVLATRARAPKGLLVPRVALGATQALSMGLLYAGQARIPSALGGVLMATTPLWVIVLARLWLGEPLRRRALAASGLGLVGVALLSGASWARALTTVGVGAVLGAAVVGAVSKTIGKRLAELPVAVLVRDLGGVVAIVALLADLALDAEPWSASPRALAAAVYLGAVASVGANAVYFVLLRRVEVSRLAYLQLVSAGVALVTGVLGAGERLGAVASAGAALVLVGAVLQATGEARRVAAASAGSAR